MLEWIVFKPRGPESEGREVREGREVGEVAETS